MACVRMEPWHLSLIPKKMKARPTIARCWARKVLILGLIAASCHVQAFGPGTFLPTARSRASVPHVTVARRVQAFFADHVSSNVARSSGSGHKSSAWLRPDTSCWSSTCNVDRSDWGPEHLVGERDACGVGFIADMTGKAGPGAVLSKALVALGCMEHRGACSADQVSSCRGRPNVCCVKKPSKTTASSTQLDKPRIMTYSIVMPRIHVSLFGYCLRAPFSLPFLV